MGASFGYSLNFRRQTFEKVAPPKTPLSNAINMSFLTEEEIDDVLYCSRVNDLEELKPLISSLHAKCTSESPASIILAAVDAETGNNAAHYACGNGHLGTVN